MPRNNKNSLLRKQAIASRLMQISLVVDDYIYKYKPISKSAASSYLKEIVSYGDKCLRDERSLQVIEKLCRHMKGIIEEYERLQHNNEEVSQFAFTKTHNYTNFISQYTPHESNKPQQTNNKIENIENPIKPIEVIEIDETDSDNDVNEANNINTYIKNQNNNLDLNLQRALSSLSIKEIDTQSVSANETEECSQSILTNFDSYLTVDKVNKENGNISMAVDEAVVQPRNILKNPLSDKTETHIETSVNISEEINNDLEKEKKGTKKATKKGRVSLISTKKVESSFENNCTTHTSVEKKTSKQKRERTKNSKKPNKPKVSKSVNAKKNPKTSVRIVNEKPLDLPNKENTDGHTEKSIKKDIFHGPDNSIVKPQNLGLALYNKNVENDLSWVENIRYVREVTSEEYEPTIIDDSFWDNFTLPINWNDNDCIYTS